MKFFEMIVWPKFRTHVILAFSTLMGLIIGGTVVYHSLENWTWIQCFYFSVTTLTTVGYGDIYPTNDASRLFTSFYVLMGVGLALLSLSIIGNDYLDRQERQMSRFKAQREILKPRMQGKLGKK